MYYAAVRARLQMKLHHFAVLIIMGAEIVAHSLLFQSKVIGDAVNASVGEGMLDAAKLFESNVHNLESLVNNRIWK